MRSRFAKRLLCVLARHDWEMSPFRALNALPGDYTLVCRRCGQHVHRNDRT